MKKKIVAIFLGLFLIVGFTGCNSSTAQNCEVNGSRVQSKYIKLTVVEQGDSYFIYRDTNTNVMYLCIGGYNSAMMTPILNSNGTPKIYKE